MDSYHKMKLMILKQCQHIPFSQDCRVCSLCLLLPSSWKMLKFTGFKVVGFSEFTWKGNL